MALQEGPQPVPRYRVRVPQFSRVQEVEAIATPRVEEGCLIVQPSSTLLLWFPLGIITGPVEVEAV